jgi:nitroreductase/NAD-dependent dihydropyrimidine dehydrogenase PreA subunit
MGLLIIDQAKCVHDGLCVKDCPAAVIQMSAEGIPYIIQAREAICFDCGHCLAVCPTGALNHARIPAEASPAIQNNLTISEEQALQFIRSRRSMRHFLDKPVDREKIIKAVNAARYAPTAGNSQMVEWFVIDDKAKMKKISEMTVNWLRQITKDPQVVAASPYLPSVVMAWDAGVDSVLRGAPALVIAAVNKQAVFGKVDLMIALSYFDLYAPTIGLGTCWAGLLEGAMVNSPELTAFIGLPETHTSHYPLMLGYPETKYYRVPERKQPKIVFA